MLSCFAYGIRHERDQLGTSAIARGNIRSAWLNTSSDTLHYFSETSCTGCFSASHFPARMMSETRRRRFALFCCTYMTAFCSARFYPSKHFAFLDLALRQRIRQTATTHHSYFISSSQYSTLEPHDFHKPPCGSPNGSPLSYTQHR